jgi:Holliday junction resolvasome RuvABC endonuclease subunit
MHVLGLDPSLTQFGWAIHDTDGQGRGACVDRGRFRTSSKMLFISRYMQMRESLANLLRETGLVHVGVEFPVFGEIWSEGMYGLFLFACEALHQERRDVVFLANNQVKVHARNCLGLPKSWKMGKADMCQAAKKAAGGGRWNHNEADAFWVAKTAGRFWNLLDGTLTEQDMSPDERRQFARIHTFKRGKKAGRTVKSGILYREDERFFRWSRGEDDE